MVPSVLCGDGLAGMWDLPPESVGLVLADLPSGMTQASFDTPFDLPEFWATVSHCLALQGSVVLLASHFVYAAEVVASNRTDFRYELIWEKSLASGFLNAKRRPLNAHEFILVFGHGVYTPQLQPSGSPIHKARRTQRSVNYGAQTSPSDSRAGATDRYPISVLPFASVGTSSKQRIHPQQKPVDLLRWLVRSYSVPEALVVDPCAGSGSTGEAAEVEGRHFIGWDLRTYG